MKTLAIIPARSGSKGIKDKNIQLLGNLPLIAYSIQAAKNSGIFDKILVSTDSKYYADIAKNYGADVPFLRSAKNSNDTATSIACILEVLECYAKIKTFFDIVVLLQPTSPFRTATDIKNAFSLFKKCDFQGLCSVHPATDNPLLLREFSAPYLENILKESSTKRRQDFKTYYKVNGAIYINLTKEITPNTSLNDNPIGFIMDPLNAIDIDSHIDFKIAQMLLSEKLIPHFDFL